MTPLRQAWLIVAGCVLLVAVGIAFMNHNDKVATADAAGEIHGIVQAPTTSRADTCIGSGTYSDLQPGAEVTATVGTQVVASAQLTQGSRNGSTCTFTWSMTGVPMTAAAVTIRYGSHGPAVVSMDDARYGANIIAP